MTMVIPVAEQLPVGHGVIEVATPSWMPQVGRTWQCLDCGAFLRLSGHHSGPHHTVIFVDGQPIYRRD